MVSGATQEAKGGMGYVGHFMILSKFKCLCIYHPPSPRLSKSTLRTGAISLLHALSPVSSPVLGISEPWLNKRRITTIRARNPCHSYLQPKLGSLTVCSAPGFVLGLDWIVEGCEDLAWDL